MANKTKNIDLEIQLDKTPKGNVSKATVCAHVSDGTDLIFTYQAIARDNPQQPSSVNYACKVEKIKPKKFLGMFGSQKTLLEYERIFADVLTKHYSPEDVILKADKLRGFPRSSSTTGIVGFEDYFGRSGDFLSATSDYLIVKNSLKDNEEAFRLIEAESAVRSAVVSKIDSLTGALTRSMLEQRLQSSVADLTLSIAKKPIASYLGITLPQQNKEKVIIKKAKSKQYSKLESQYVLNPKDLGVKPLQPSGHSIEGGLADVNSLENLDIDAAIMRTRAKLKRNPELCHLDETPIRPEKPKALQKTKKQKQEEANQRTKAQYEEWLKKQKGQDKP